MLHMSGKPEGTFDETHTLSADHNYRYVRSALEEKENSKKDIAQHVTLVALHRSVGSEGEPRPAA